MTTAHPQPGPRDGEFAPAHGSYEGTGGPDASGDSERYGGPGGYGGPAPMFGPAFTGLDRAELYRRLRAEHGPVAPVTLLGDVPAWLVLGYRELHDITGDPELFTRDSAIWNRWDDIPQDWPLMPMLGRQPSILYEDGDRHRRRSELVGDTLGAVDPFELRELSEQLADRLIDGFCGRGRADLIAEYTRPLPALVLSRLYGFADEQAASLAADINSLVDGDADALRSSQRLRRAMGELLRSRAIAPAADVASRMQQHANSAEFSAPELLEDLVANIIVGQQPTADWMGNSLRLMLTDDRFSESLAGGRNSIAEAMNEVLWEETPTQNMAGRWATRDTVLGGRGIRRGDLLVLSFAGANADPRVRPDQSAFTGGNSAFLSFGHGEHRCPYPAQEIAEGIARTGIEVLLDRLPDVDLDVPREELVWRASPWLRGLESLPVAFSPAPARDGRR